MAHGSLCVSNPLTPFHRSFPQIQRALLDLGAFAPASPYFAADRDALALAGRAACPAPSSSAAVAATCAAVATLRPAPPHVCACFLSTPFFMCLCAPTTITTPSHHTHTHTHTHRSRIPCVRTSSVCASPLPPRQRRLLQTCFPAEGPSLCSAPWIRGDRSDGFDSVLSLRRPLFDGIAPMASF